MEEDFFRPSADQDLSVSVGEGAPMWLLHRQDGGFIDDFEPDSDPAGRGGSSPEHAVRDIVLAVCTANKDEPIDEIAQYAHRTVAPLPRSQHGGIPYRHSVTMA